MTSATRNRSTVTASVAPPAHERSAMGRLGAAEVRWNDYRGTAAADDSIALLDTRSLYEIANLDRSRWTIVGIDASLAATAERIVIFAVDRTVEPDIGAREPDELTVTAFHVDPSTRVDQFLHEAFQRVSLRLISALAAGRGLRVDAHVALAPE